jgi:hypothetical protein
MSRQKKKKLTNKQMQRIKELRDEWRESGLIPPVKPRLNRKKFTKEVTEEFKDFNVYSDALHLINAIRFMLPSESAKKITPEHIGVLKLLKLAMEIKKFKRERIAQGETQYNVMDMYEKIVAPVLNL